MADQTQRVADRRSILAIIAWAIYGSLYVAGFWFAGCVAGFVVMLLIIANEYRRGGLKIMDCTSLAYFALAAAISATSAAYAFDRYHVVIVWGVFAAVAWATLAAGFPFTIQYARERAPREAWNSPAFARINRTLTVMWAAIFTFGAIMGVMTIAVGHAFALGIAIPMSAMGVGYAFNSEYPKRFADRRDTAARAAPAATHQTGIEATRRADG